MIDSIRAKKSLGQNFLKDPSYLKKIVDAAGIGPGDRVLEIGPGLGHLTEFLSKRAEHVLALELDDRLIPHLQKEFPESGNVEIVHADALDYPYASLNGKWKVTANLPYYISTPLIQRLLASVIDLPVSRSCSRRKLQTELLQLREGRNTDTSRFSCKCMRSQGMSSPCRPAPSHPDLMLTPLS